jgi:eukaryotic-like serine/threonine-protein kinase
MNRDRWQQIERMLDEALSRDRSEWPALLDAGCAGDAELRQEVMSLLGRVTAAERFLDAPPTSVAAALVASARGPGVDAVPAAGRRIGAYRILREIGHGGMARVFLAERADGAYAQTVALKLLRANLDSDIDRARFRIERQVLATLNHPNIARLFEGGVTEEGVSYLALEYVNGEPLDRYCDARGATIEARLALFATVARATQYAHSNLVVHRDLKPSNIFVNADGEVKLLDFGLAKLLEGGEDEAAATRAGYRWLTPEYAAPEQILGERVTTLTDVYQLGVVLYELLTGRLPFAGKARSTRELEEAVLHEDPPLPSTVLGPLRGDLDAIVMHALRKEPASRYPSAAALLDDLQRFHDGLPVRARRNTAPYRFRKFVRRHRVGMSLAMVAAVALAGIVTRERSLRARAETEARKATAVEDYLVRVFDVADPFAPPDERAANMTAREILDRGAVRIDSGLTGQPDVQAELRTVVSRVYTRLGLLSRAAPMLQKALAQQRALHGERHPEVARVLDQLGDVLMQQNDFAAAEPLLREGLAQRRALLGDVHVATAESADHLATLLQEQGKLDDAEALFRDALATRRSLFGDDDQRVAESLNNLGLLLWMRTSYDSAAALYRRALAIQERRLGPDHPMTAMTVHNLAQTQQLRGDLADAERLFRRALIAKRKALGDAHPSVTVNLNNLAALLREQGRLDEAEVLLREALALDRRIFGERHDYVAASLDNLATVLRRKGDFDEALGLYRHALAINRQLHGPEHSRVALTLSNIGATLDLQGDHEAAIEMFRQAEAQYAHLYGAKHPFRATVALNLARALRLDGQMEEAERIYRSIAVTMDSTNGAQRTPYMQSLLGLGVVLTSRGRLDEARPLLERSFEAIRRQYGDTSWRTAEPRLALGRWLAASGDRAGAVPLLREAVALSEKVSRGQPALAREARAELARWSAVAVASPRRTR